MWIHFGSSMLRALITSLLHFGKLAPEAEETALYFSLPYSYDPLRKQNNKLENYQKTFTSKNSLEIWQTKILVTKTSTW